MSDPAGGEDRMLTPEQEDQVRRALAAWRPGGDTPVESMPADVADRLAGVIDELAADRVVGADRRRRRWPNLLAAAAAVSVLGLGIGTVLTGGGGAGDSVSTVDAGAGSQAESAPKAADDASSADELRSGSVGGYAAGKLPKLDRDTLRRDVARLSDRGTTLMTDGAGPTPASGQSARCALPEPGAGERVVLARLDRRVVGVVLGGPVNGTREAHVYSCDDRQRLIASFVVPAR